MENGYSMLTVMVFEAALMFLILWGVVVFPMLCRFMGHGKDEIGELSNEAASFSRVKRSGATMERCVDFFSRLSMAAAGLLAVSFVLH